MGLIRELPAALVNQIAAGEVVERPSSVLKELLENSLDAGAKRVSVVVDPTGAGLIRVEDNGSGIMKDDLPRAFLRHATSKISSFEDLVRARSMGFRGEALASIASVARVTLETRHPSDAVGSRMEWVPGEDPVISSWDRPVGTAISVRDLFFNVPVRKKYLRSPQTEQGHLTETFQRVALGFPDVHFDLSTPSRKIFSLPARHTPLLRILDIYPSFQEDDLLYHERGGEDLRISLVLLRPDRLRKDRQFQHLFINRRWIRHPALFEAITQGASGRISRDLHPGAWVFLDLPPDRIDVNVHPTKREVRLLDGDRIFSLLRRVISEAFEGFSERFLPGEVLSESFRSSSPAILPSSLKPPEIFPEREDRRENSTGLGPQEKTPLTPESRSAPRAMGSVDSSSLDSAIEARSGPPPSYRSGRSAPLFSQERKEEGGRPSYREIPEILKSLPSVFSGKRPDPETISVVGQWAGTYLVAIAGEDLWLVDWHTAHERINYDRYRQALLGEGKGGSRRNLLFPVTYRVPPTIADNLDSRLEELSHLGFDIDRSGPDLFRIRAVPTLLDEPDPTRAMDELGAHSQGFEVPILRSDRIDETLMTLSCHRSVRKNDVFVTEEGARLIRELLDSDHPYSCPHGRPTILSLSHSAIDTWFGR
ncbi:MAG: DNA mismatch repair endonuclease MutL [Leptospirillia bacterium]